MIGLDSAKRATPLDLELSIWGAMDRTLATLAGYTALSVLGAMYVRKGSPFSNGQVGREWEATIIDLLNQAGGVMKVILIISIEMLVFPLYCGLLLDAALLPLFENATLMSRILFTIKSPCTSIFVHWFVGTCYMFHFALFVSMCRKIMRKGVLYFIRDPDDPTFHPVRDVLERNVATQLRKILFSALVYGALVVICLGGVVWGLSWVFKGVLPIHWSSNEPVLEFPIDLLFYNFLMPLAVKFFKPSDGLHAMYSWWFRQCARMLRLTWFMFDERQQDEEGYIVRRSWKDMLQGLYGDALPSMKVEDPSLPFKDDPSLKAFIMQDGRYVRAPASDQVRVKKGAPIFLEVDEFNNRLDKELNRPAGEADWDSDLYKQVYVPPHFRLRITAFIISIWIFAALTGVCITIVPLVFGREVFSMIIPANVRKNDVYAFSIGIYILGSALYMILHVRQFVTYLVKSLSLNADTPRNVFRIASNIALRIAKIAWTYSAVIFLLPTLCAFLTEFYAIIPLHTYFSPAEPHTIHFVQSWTLGLLYVKLTTRLIQFYPGSRPAASLQLIIRDGYLNPDAGLATRAFILPATVALLTALFWPWALARLAVLTIFKSIPEHDKILVYRYTYPVVLLGLCIGYLIYLLCLAVRGWRMRIRDEVYLIGERLHNFGERKSGPGSGIGVRRIET
jgi:E3 ubiquitin-protein ligase MARCH6